MRKRYLAPLILVLCAALPVWAEEAQAGSAPETPALSNGEVLTPPVPPGLPVPAVAPVQPDLPPLTVDLSQPITVEQALTVAFERNPELRIAVDQAQRAVAVIGEARAAFNPRFNAQATYTRQPGSVATLPGGPGEPDRTIQIQNPDSTTLAVTGSLPLDINRRLSFATEIARYQFDIQYLTLVSQAETLIQNVKVAYYDLLRAVGQASVAQAAVDVATVRLENTRARFQAGVVPRFDVTTAEVDVGNLNQQLIQAQTRVELARTVLNSRMGISANYPTQIVTVDPEILLTVVDVDASIATAHQRRPEVRAARAAVDLNQTNVKLQRTGLLPSLAINANTIYNVETTAFSGNNVNWQVSAVLSVPIWDGGITRARVQQAREDVDVAADRVDQAELGVGVDVRSAALNVQEAARRAQTTARAVDLAEEALRLANVRYEAGIATLVEVTNAEAQLTQARFNLVNARYDYAAAVAALQRATSTQPELDQVQLMAIQQMHE